MPHGGRCGRGGDVGFAVNTHRPAHGPADRTRRRFLAACTAATLPAFVSARPGPSSGVDPADRVEPAPPPRLAGLGVNLAGAEFAAERDDFSNADPGAHGREYLWHGTGYLAALADRGVRLLRVPMRWERVQPAPGGPLDPRELDRLLTLVSACGDRGVGVIPDVHNYARYRLHRSGTHRARRVREYVIDQREGNRTPISRDHFADLWARLARVLAGHPAVVGYGLMNEPHDLDPHGLRHSHWPTISQAAVDAVRRVDPLTPVLVAGDGWSNARRWHTVNPPTPWVRDPAGRVIYEAHCYLDADGTGTYGRPFAEEFAADPTLPARAARRLRPFLGWCARHRVPGFVGEFGVPTGDPGWAAAGRPLRAALRAAGVPGCAWAAGAWWGDYPLALHPGRPAADAALAALTDPPRSGG